MYSGIFEDFKIIKRHCQSNHIVFEESAVFELLENLYPENGSEQSVQLIIEMLDAQRIRDCRDSPNIPVVDALNSDKSNDTDIIEVEVPKKIHPIIDLTDNCESNETEKFTNENSNSNIDINIGSDVIDNNSSDSHSNGSNLLKHAEEDWDQTLDGIMKSYDDTSSLMNFPMMDRSNTLNFNRFDDDVSNSGPLYVAEMLEENNNDPNNNLDGTIFEAEPTDLNAMVNNNNHRLDTIHNLGDTNSNDVLIEKIIDPIPGCSKDTDLKVKTQVRDISSPLPGCSKDFDSSDDCFEAAIAFDESIQNDAICIQEIVSWANLETIYSILNKHRDSPNRKQLTLWDLVSEESNQSFKTPKRKQSSEGYSSNKMMKVETLNNDVDDSLFDYAPNLQSHTVTCNESSNDSLSSKLSDGNEFKFSNPEIMNKNQKDKFSRNITSKKGSSIINISNKLSNNIQFHQNPSLLHHTESMAIDVQMNESYLNNSPAITSNSFTSTPCPIKKEISETVVSGSSKFNSVIKANDQTQTIKLLPITSLKDRSEDSPCLSTTSSKECNNTSNGSLDLSKSLDKNDLEKVGLIKKELEKSAKVFLNNTPTLTKDVQNIAQENSSSNPSKINVIKPPKLLLYRVSDSNYAIKEPVTTTSYIRPAIFNYTNTNAEAITKVKVRRDLSLPNMLYASGNESSGIPINTTQSTIVQENKLKIPVTQRNETVVHASQVTQNFLPRPVIKKCPKRPAETNTFATNTSAINVPWALNGTNKSAKPIIRTPTLNLLQSRTMVTPGHTTNVRVATLKTSSTVTIPHVIHRATLPKAEPTATVTSSRPVQTTTNTTVVPSVNSSNSNAPSNSVSNSQYNSRPFDVAMYNKLRSIFPAVKKSYVKRICKHPPVVTVTNISNNNYVLNVLIEHLLAEGHNHVQPQENNIEQEATTALSVDEQYECLLGIFPDADPIYLREVVEKSIKSKQDLEQFIQRNLETRDYPTKEQYLARIKFTEQQKQYTTDFKIEKFLELFPDPFKHFENGNRKCTYRPLAMEFLKSFFNRNKVSTISNLYTVNKYNLSLTAKALSNVGFDMKSKRISIEMPTEDIPLLQELAFIKNKKNIQKFIDTLKTEEEVLFKSLKEKNALLTCQCCFHDECMPTKCSECNNGHVFCHECIVRGTESALAKGEAHVRCFTECQSDFSLATLQKVLPPTKFSALLKKRQAAEVLAAGVDGLVSCPFCHFASIPPPEDKVFKCLNPECMKETCRQCHELNHVPLRCDEVVKTARLLIEEKMTEALLRTCYQCKCQFYKDEGCNKMQCTCGALMCYLCDKPVSSYAHFNAQGGTKVDLCPLYSDDRRMNAEAVIKVAEDVKKNLLKANPNLQLDIEKLLPKLPPKSKGPHDDIANSHQLPDHIRRVAGAAP